MILIRIITLFLLLISANVFATEKVESTLCGEKEGVFFSCMVGHKTLSICTSPKIKPYSSLEYRYGTGKKIEFTYIANINNGNRFFASIDFAVRDAIINQVWFKNEDFTYAITECVGGGCPIDAGLIVFNRERVISQRACESKYYYNKAPYSGHVYGHASFELDVVAFEENIEKSISNTELLILKQQSINVDMLYVGIKK